MKNKLTLLFAFLFVFTISKAQQTAMQFTGLDCNSNAVDLYADLNAGKAVVLFYYMANCGTCPPVAQKIQTMANHINSSYPGMVKAYAFPYNNSTNCSYSISWVNNNNLSLYTPMDSGAVQVAYYGGFGMPTVVLVGGTDHRVMFSTLSFATGDTTIMRDSILNLLSPAGLADANNLVSAVKLFPNPANQNLQLELNMAEPASLKIEIVNMVGELVQEEYNASTAPGLVNRKINTEGLSNGVYFIRITADNKVQNYQFTVAH